MSNQPRDPRNRRRASSPVGPRMVIISGEASEKTQQMLIRYQFIASLVGLVIGLVLMILGAVLFLNGVTGSTSFVAEVLGLKGRLANASPGALLSLIGLFIIYVTRFNVKIQK